MAAISELEKQLRESVGEVKIPFETVVLSTIVERATLKSARALDPSNWPEAARHFYSVYLDRELDTSTRIEGLTGAAQMLINRNEIDRAIGMLEGGRVLLEDLSGDERLIAESDINIRIGWALDLKGDFVLAAEKFSSARESLNKTQDKKATGLEETARHFLAREKIALATKGIDVETNLQEGENLLREDMELHPNE